MKKTSKEFMEKPLGNNWGITLKIVPIRALPPFLKGFCRKNKLLSPFLKNLVFRVPLNLLITFWPVW